MVLQLLLHLGTQMHSVAAVQAVREVSKRPVILISRDANVIKAGLKDYKVKTH